MQKPLVPYIFYLPLAITLGFYFKNCGVAYWFKYTNKLQNKLNADKEMVWIFMGTKYMGKANNTQINEHKQSFTKSRNCHRVLINKCVD